jgi:Domain of unknown function (DUF4037)
MAFIHGIELARRLYADAVRPVLDRELPGLPHAAALIGPGSEVLGFDTVRSMDHDWGPRVQLFISPDHRPHLTDLFTGLPVELVDLGEFCVGRLGFDPRHGVSTEDWLTTPSQRLAEMTAGAVFHDGTGELTAVREALRWYPDEIWRFVLAGQWQRIGQEEPFVGRCGEVGDELGSAVVAARLARDVMRLCLLMDRRYPPYGKWLGTAFARLPGIGTVHEGLTTAVRAERWTERQAGLCQAYEAVAARHNDLRLTQPLEPTVRPFYDRPFLVLGAGRFAAALQSTVADPALRSLPLIGGVDQVVDNTDVLERPSLSRSR